MRILSLPTSVIGAPCVFPDALRQRRLQRLGMPAATARTIALLAFGEPTEPWRHAASVLVTVEANHG